MANLVADLNTENPPYLCGFRKIASEAPFHRTFSTNMRARSSWQSPGVGKLNTKTTGQTSSFSIQLSNLGFAFLILAMFQPQLS